MDDPRYLARALVEVNVISVEGLWFRYWGHGGSADAFEFEACLYEVQKLAHYELSVLGWAMEDLEAGPPM